MENQNQTTNEIKKSVTHGPIEVSRVYASDYQKKGTLTAELKQKVITIAEYPKQRISNSLNGNIFSGSEFNIESEKYETTETRVAWIDVPQGSTVQTVVEKLKQFPNATLYKVMKNYPILADTDKYAIEAPELNVTLDTYANRQVVRYPDNHEKAGQIIPDNNGKVQYRRIAFSVEAKEDMDLRTSDPKEVYMSPEIEAEINDVITIDESQKI